MMPEKLLARFIIRNPREVSMWKYIVAFIVIVFLIAIIIGQNNEESFDEEIYIKNIAIHESGTIDSTVTRIESLKESALAIDRIDNLEVEVLLKNIDVPHQLLTRMSYTTSYNKQTKCPNWVAWHLTAEHTEGEFSRRGVPYFEENGEACGIGKVNRETSKGDYFVDVEAEMPRQEFSDWDVMPVGMSHGHICPAGDNKWSKAAMNQSFLLTNMCPQTEKLNGGGWKKLEEKCRDWAIKYEDIYIVSGPIFYEGVRRCFGKNKIGIPDAFFKVVLCVNGKPKAIGFIYSNDSSSQSMAQNVHSVNEIEEIVGMDFFFYLPDSIENKVEAMTNLEMW